MSWRHKTLSVPALSPGVSGVTFLCSVPILTAQGLSWYLIIHHHSREAQKSDRAVLQAFSSPCSRDGAAKRGECFKPAPQCLALLEIHFHESWESQADSHRHPAGIQVGGLCQSRAIDLLVLIRELRLYPNVFAGKKHWWQHCD